jgi:AraC family transcriptional activator of pobA
MPKRSAQRIPSFSLYGERAEAGHAEALHIEDIQSRSRKYLWNIATHRHAGLCQCLLVAAGPITAQLEERRVALQGPALVTVPAGTVHAFEFAENTDGWVLTLEQDRLLGAASVKQRAAVQCLLSQPRVEDMAADAALFGRAWRAFCLLADEFRQPDSAHTPACAWLASGALAILAHGLHLGEGQVQGLQENRSLRAFRELVEIQYLNHWSVRRYAERLGVSETTLNRLCHKLCGGSAFHLVQQRLALEARRRLMYLASSINLIAAELGFEDAAYFARFFRRHNGMSPNEFRRRHGGG